MASGHDLSTPPLPSTYHHPWLRSTQPTSSIWTSIWGKATESLTNIIAQYYHLTHKVTLSCVMGSYSWFPETPWLISRIFNMELLLYSPLQNPAVSPDLTKPLSSLPSLSWPPPPGGLPSSVPPITMLAAIILLLPPIHSSPMCRSLEWMELKWLVGYAGRRWSAIRGIQD